MNTDKIIADLLLPDITTSPEYYEKLYPERSVPDGAIVTRFAPSPTGYLHLGGLFASLVEERLAHQSGGIFYLRIEDTDKKREVGGCIPEIPRGLLLYNIFFDEGMTDGCSEKGSYGPYKQSERAVIYKTYVKYLLEKGLAYPCFCTHEELSALRKHQEDQKLTPGYYGQWAKHRNINLQEIMQLLSEGRDYVIRLKSPGNPEARVSFEDLIKGPIEMPENIQDVVILKSDGLPTYHFAHAVDDHLMRTTHVIRGEEWLSSVPIHLQLFDILGFKKPYYAHIPTIMKMDGNSKRKLSKRKDPEAAFRYYEEQGYPSVSVTEYLFQIINSDFEDWRRENPGKFCRDFKIDIKKMSPAGALFDLDKLMNVSKDIIASLSAEEAYDMYMDWAERFDPGMYQMVKSSGYGPAVFNIERGIAKPRKDIAKWNEVRGLLGFFFDELFFSPDNIWNYPASLGSQDIKAVLLGYSRVYSPDDSREEWFDKIKYLAEELGFSKDVKAYKKNPSLYMGHVGDVAMILRIGLCKQSNTPDLYEIMKLLGPLVVDKRLKAAFEAL